MLRWPLREALLAYLHALQVEALAAWRHARLEWIAVAVASGGKAKAPELPALLRGAVDDDA